MFTFTSSIINLFGSIQSFYESDSELSCTLSTDKLPTIEGVLSLLSFFPSTDKPRIIISDQADDKVRITGLSLWQDEYLQYQSNHDVDDMYTTQITIDKGFCKTYGIYIYSSTDFLKYIQSLSTIKIIHLFSDLLRKNTQFLRFTVLDEGFSLYTEHIAFCKKNDTWPIGQNERSLLMKRCEDSSSFLNHHDLLLLPHDFHVIHANEASLSLEATFKKIEALFGYAYTAISAYLTDEKLIIYTDPGIAKEVPLDSFPATGSIVAIYRWIFSTENSMERASIARNILKLYCRTNDQLLDIDNSVLLSIKSNYNIYQKDTTEKYIELKENIGQYIVNTTGLVQELIHGLVEGFRNNFVAIVTFVITVVLTNSLSGSEILADGLPRNLVFVSYIFIGVTLVYLLASLLSLHIKWRFIRQSYFSLKDNYRSLLDSKDLDEAFRNDEILLSSRKKIIVFAVLISVIWLAFVGGMYIAVKCFSSDLSSIVDANEAKCVVRKIFSLFCA